MIHNGAVSIPGRCRVSGFYSEVTVILDELLCYVMTLNWEHVNIAKRS